MTKQDAQLEKTVLAHRYLYYVCAHPIISDRRYDELEKEARAILPKSSDVNKVGSAIESEYSEPVKELARKLHYQAT